MGATAAHPARLAIARMRASVFMVGISLQRGIEGNERIGVVRAGEHLVAMTLPEIAPEDVLPLVEEPAHADAPPDPPLTRAGDAMGDGLLVIAARDRVPEPVERAPHAE